MAIDTDDYADLDARTELTATGLATELRLMIECGKVDWLVDGVVEACANGDLAYLRRQVERHVDGWVTP